MRNLPSNVSIFDGVQIASTYPSLPCLAMSDESYAEVLRAIQAAERICITTHLNPDGDGIGAVLALLIASARGL